MSEINLLDIQYFSLVKKISDIKNLSLLSFSKRNKTTGKQDFDHLVWNMGGLHFLLYLTNMLKCTASLYSFKCYFFLHNLQHCSIPYSLCFAASYSEIPCRNI